MKTFESSCYFSYVWVKMVKKLPYTSPIAFDYFIGHLQEGCVRLFVSMNFIYIYLEWFIYMCVWGVHVRVRFSSMISQVCNINTRQVVHLTLQLSLLLFLFYQKEKIHEEQVV